ncbi:hypothetical protein BDP27DRAFT_1526052 [Rhodocollybia butyracea]|uniref:F-box domain-containing protein n=1 Tax=Rhodocollybia butyracea TaxID=206335 RepID=A0A9P5Q7P7_9AGAR|nr:hypothetical protein BDP27DRAFT_1526052 [Rhodocollybia butyracea]
MVYLSKPASDQLLSIASIRHDKRSEFTTYSYHHLTVMSLLVELPNDVLFNIFKLLRPSNIFSVQKTCKRFLAITMDRCLWTSAYKCSEDDFLLVIDPYSQTVGELEPYGIDSLELQRSEIYQGRYLIIWHSRVILVLDLQTKHVVFRYDVPDDACLLLTFAQSRIAKDSRVHSLFWNTQSRTMSSLHINPLGDVTVGDLSFLDIDNEMYLSGDEFAIVPQTTFRAVHIPSQAVYPIHSTSGMPVDNNYSAPIFLPGGYVLFHTGFFHELSDHHFQLYRLSCHTSAWTPLLPTHQGHFGCAAASLLSSDISLNSCSELTGRIWLLVDTQKEQHILKESRCCPAKRWARAVLALELSLVSMDLGEQFIRIGPQLEMDYMDVLALDGSRGFLVTIDGVADRIDSLLLLSPMLLLVELPEDVLFNIVRFLRPGDIFSIRKTCKCLLAITKYRHVWVTAYKSCEDDFLPVVDLASQTIDDLQRVLLRYHQLETLWTTPSAKLCRKKFWSIDAAAYGIVPRDTDVAEVYQGHYLVLRSDQAIHVFDLRTKDEIFRYDAPEDTRLRFLDSELGVGATRIFNNDTDFCLLFCFTYSKTVSLFRISPLGVISVRDCPKLPLSGKIHWAGTMWAIVSPTQANKDILWWYPIFLPGGYVLRWFSSIEQSSPHHFELYHLSCRTPGKPLLPTHRGHYVCSNWSFRLLCSEISLNDRSELTGHIWLLKSLGATPQPVCITLHAGGDMSFSVAPSLSSLYTLDLTAHAQGKSRGIGLPHFDSESGEKQHWTLWHFSMDLGKLVIQHGAQWDVHTMPGRHLAFHRGFMINIGEKIKIDLMDEVS